MSAAVDEFPVSPAQARLLVAEALNPGSAQYHVPLAFRVRGRFDGPAFGRAVQALVARHEALRTTFRSGPHDPVQVVAAQSEAEVRVEPPAPATEVEARMRAEAARPFDLATGPLLRCTIYQVCDGSHRVLLSAHHLVCDGWSMQIMLAELAEAYRSDLDGVRYQPGEPSLQYPDVAAWQADRLRRGGYGTAIDHWARQLHDASQTLDLPTDRPRAAVRSAVGGTVSFRLPGSTRERLAGAARARAATPFMALFAAYAAFLGRLCGRDDLVIGVPVSGRDRADLHQTVGLLTNTLALPTDLSGDPSFHELIDQVRGQMLSGAPYQDAPFDAVVDAVVGTREPSQDPLVQVMFGYDDDSELNLRLAGAQVDRVELILDVAKFDLTLYVERWGADLVAQLIYRTDLLDRATVAGWAGSFQALLAGLLDRPDSPLSRAEMLSASDRRRILQAGDRTGLAAPAGAKLLPDLVAERAAASPDATALVCGDITLTYRQLLARADRLAVRLRAAGVGPDVPVGLLLPRSADLPVAVLGVLRAGGAYVPLDPADPPARLAYQTADSGAQLLLATAQTAGAAQPLAVPVLRTDIRDEVPEGVNAGPGTGPVPGPHHLAYVLYTSGSTGTPKGVAVEHRALTNLALAVAPEMGVEEGDRVLQFFSFSFDVAVADLALTWVAGAELHLAQEQERLGDALFARLDAARISYADLPPAAAMTLPRPGALDRLRTLVVGGEQVPGELVTRVAAPGRRVVNAYGPTEATVWSTTTELRPGAPVAIGRAVPGARTYVLDRRLRVVPHGVVGEIFVAGEPLARGYSGRPGLTAERFVADPYGPPGSRMYRTGDLGRYDASGQLHFRGRTDTQVKVRGFRIELGEIEAQLMAHPEVAVAVAAAPGAGVDRRLVAYVIGIEGHRPLDDSLRAHLAARLPRYLVPEQFIHLDELPVNRSGKVDRDRLPDPPAARPDLAQSYVPPVTPTQQQVVAVWARVLGHDHIGVRDNFFDLGGNSVRLLRVCAALRETVDPGLELVDLFRHPTVAALADHLDRRSIRPDRQPVESAGTDAVEPRLRGTTRRELLAAAARQRRTGRAPPDD